MKKYVRSTREYLETTTIRKGIISSDCKIAVRNDDGVLENTYLDFSEIKRKDEFSSAGHLLLADAAKYVCTHMAKSLNDKSSWYYEIRLRWDDFQRMTIGDPQEMYFFKKGKSHDAYPILKDKLYEALAQGERRCLIREEDGKLIYGKPFRWDLELEDNSTLLSADMVRKLGNIGTKKIVGVRLSFNKSLFRPYVKGNSYYQYPPCLYAKTYMLLSTLTLDDLREIEKDEQTAIRQYETMRSKIYLRGYIAGVDYLYLMGAGSPSKQEVEEFRNFRGTNFQGHKMVKIPVGDFLKSVMPSLIRERKNKIEIRNPFDVETFRRALTYITNLLDGLDFKIKKENGYNPDYQKTGTIEWKIEHSQRVLELCSNKKP
jgi:hypothetical protein